MKKTLILTAAALTTLGFAAQSQQPTEEMMRIWRQTVTKRDISQKAQQSNIPLSQVPATKRQAAKDMPTGRVWFPGEWEEVKAIVVTPYYEYSPATNQGTGYWTADPLVTGYASYYKYNMSTSSWDEQGTGPYTATMDTRSTFGKVSFYLMDAIQKGGAEAWVRIENAEDSATVINTLTQMNLKHDNVHFLIGPGNSFWYRDCGPICFYHGEEDNLAMLDFTYYPGRALDDSLPTIIHSQKGIPNYFTDIEWEGGNCLVDGAGMVISSDAIYSGNSDRYGQLIWDGQDINTLTYKQKTPMSRQQVMQGLSELLGQRATYILPAYRYDGGTGHIDLYADMWDENGFVFSVMPDSYSNWTDYRTGQKNIDSLTSYSSVFDRSYYTMATLPFPSKDNGSNFSNQTQYNNQYTRTYSNHTFVNNLIIQPCFSTVGSDGLPTAAWDRENIAKIQQAYPGYTIYCVDVREFDGSGGAIHCITKQIPADNPVRILHKNLHDTVALGGMNSIPVSAVITNRSGIAHAEVMYRVPGSQYWRTLNLTANGNRWHGSLPVSETAGETLSYEYYISATSNNGKTITKPMTASQGGYYSFTYSRGGTLDSTQFDFNTEAVPAEDITFVFGNNWVTEDDAPVGIEEVSAEGGFGQFYPNPASGASHVDIDLGEGGSYAVSIVDATGRTVHATRLQAAGQIVYTVNASRLSGGIYHVVFEGEGCRVVRRLVVR